MDAVEVARRLVRVIDEHLWEELPRLLASDFVCRYVHTGEEFDRSSWVRLNAGYPGFQNLVLEDCVGGGDRAAVRAHVTGLHEGGLQHFGVAMFLTTRDGLVAELTEVWTDVSQAAPAHRRSKQPVAWPGPQPGIATRSVFR